MAGEGLPHLERNRTVPSLPGANRVAAKVTGRTLHDVEGVEWDLDEVRGHAVKLFATPGAVRTAAVDALAAARQLTTSVT